MISSCLDDRHHYRREGLDGAGILHVVVFVQHEHVVDACPYDACPYCVSQIRFAVQRRKALERSLVKHWVDSSLRARAIMTTKDASRRS